MPSSNITHKLSIKFDATLLTEHEYWFNPTQGSNHCYSIRRRRIKMANCAQGFFEPTVTPELPDISCFPVPTYELLSTPSSSEEDEDKQDSSSLSQIAGETDGQTKVAKTSSNHGLDSLISTSTETSEFLAPPNPPNERERRSALYRYRIFHTNDDVNFDRIINLTAKLFDASICVISLINTDEQWIKADKGFGLKTTKRSHTFCGHTILNHAGNPMVVLDASKVGGLPKTGLF
ncbi:hypothetical protein BZG36_00586 [Bifiguratus adelaidae]|uniref:GAF domain-containing protein n=1 Tax=Bifiguratus adelaidae TaxID=1938954 RepID=A0A261Y7D5_9FUNG|nr:hypothetical protein BZG36_00586 [Bifiguratus adelaidae]